MSVKKLFDNNLQIVTVGKFLKLSAPDTLGDGIESEAHLSASIQKQKYFLPPVDYSKPESFVRFGSAEQYYSNAFNYIANYYPYDGSILERVGFYNKINPLEKYILEDVYPTSTGYVTIGADYGAISSHASGYYSSSAEYIQIKGGPHSGSIYKESKNRTSNLEFGGPSGSSVEFFLKKNSEIDASTSSERQVIFDLWNGAATTSAQYGRLRIELRQGTEDRFYVTMKSGSHGFDGIPVPTTGGISISDGVFRNFSFVFNTSGSSPTIDFFVNGACVQTAIPPAVSAEIGLVTGSMIGNIGALRTDISGLPGAAQGYGKLSASVDEFRFWKTNRNDEQIGRYWFDSVGGGTDKYDANVGLGVYLKFNEGITQTASIDSICLDYSGRLSNGAFTGYNTTHSRNTASAVDSLELESVREVGDPIIRTSNPLYVDTKAAYVLTGSNYDYNNNSRLLNHLPNWIIEEEENGENEIVSVTQILSSYFDTLYNQLTALKELRHVKYISGSATGSINEYPYNDRLVESMGLEMPEFFQNAGTLQQFLQRDEQINFEQRLIEVKNSIYKNIYNNLSFILKSKGTEKSIRNFIRCLGVGEEVIALNTYPDNSDFEVKSNYISTMSTKKFADFTGLLNQGDVKASVYQYPDASNTNSKGFVTGSLNLEEFAFSLQSEIVFPDKDNPELLPYEMPRVLTSSLMGFHTPFDTDQTSTDMTWQTAGNDHGLQVYAIRSPGEYPKVYSPNYRVRDAYFVVKNRAGTTLLSSSIFNDVYDNQKWNFTLSLRPTKYPFTDAINGASVSTDGYTLELYGVNYDTGVKRNSFLASASMTYNDAAPIIESNKRIYVGAHRTNFTGSTLEKTDVRASSVRFWTDYFPSGTLDLQAKEADTHGRLRPYRNAYSFQAQNPNVYIPRIQTLALNWDFGNITGSDASGRFVVQDFSSGSVAADYPSQYQKAMFSNINLRQHSGRGDFFAASSTPVRKAYIHTSKLQVPEYVGGEEMVQALNSDEQTFGIYTRPETFYFAVERSMYRSISNRMLELFASIEDFNNLIGEPVNKYRLNYKRMEKVREIFFRKVRNDIPDLEKYIDYFKWLDTSMSQVIEEFFPESARHASDVRKIVENHVLERPKIQHKISILRDRHPGGPGGLLGAPRGTICLDIPGWAKNHHPVSGNQNENCVWWQTRAERDVPPLVADSDGILATRNAVLNAWSREIGPPHTVATDQKATQRGANSIVCISAKLIPPYYGGINQYLNKKRRFRDLTFDRFEAFPDCTDEDVPNEKKKVAFRATKDGNLYKGSQITPFTAVSSSIVSGYNAGLNSSGLTGISLTNIHEDSVLPYRQSVPMQGPFAERWVGGIQARHNAPFRTVDRAEEYSLEIASGTGSITTLTIENKPKGQYLRGLASKSPLNIANIKTVISDHQVTDGVRKVGNYSKYYEVVQGNNRADTNMDFVFNNSHYAYSAPTAFLTTPARRALGLTGSADYPAPRQIPSRRINETIFTDRFAAPGSKQDSKQQFRDVNSDQFSPNNALPFRNMAVRLPHNENLKKHSTFGGFETGSSVIPSIHKTPMNRVNQLMIGTTFPTTTVITGSTFDNGYVTRALPAADRSQWTSYISGSDNSAIYGQYVALRSRYPENISFVTQSLNAVSSWDSALIFDLAYTKKFKWSKNRDFVPWKQISNGTDPYAKFYTQKNTYNVLPQVQETVEQGTGLPMNSFSNSTSSRQVTDRKGNTSNYYYSVSLREAPVTSRYKPLIHQIKTPLGTPAKTLGEKITVSMKYSYGNELMGFANRELNRQINGGIKFSYGKIKRPYEILRDQFVPPTPRVANGADLIKVFSYPETIYPKEIYTYFSGSRARLSFINDFWRSDIAVSSYDVSSFSTYADLRSAANKLTYVRQLPRVETPFVTSQGYTVQASEQKPYNSLDASAPIGSGNGSGSMWPLDSYLYSDSTGSLVTILTASVPVVFADAATMPCGELMMTHYGTINDKVTNASFRDGTASYAAANINSAQYVYNIPVTTTVSYATPAVPATASITAVETVASILDGQTIIITTTTTAVTFTFDQTKLPSDAGLRVNATSYFIGCSGVSTTNDVINAIYTSVSLCKSNAEIDVTPVDPGAVGAVMQIVADVAGVAMNGQAITGTGISGGQCTQVAFAGGVAAGTAFSGELPEPRSPGSAYTRPAWTAGRDRRYVDGPRRGQLAPATYPFYGSYEDYVSDIRLVGKDHTILPEFRISEHIEQYQNEGSLFAVISASLEITGSNTSNFDGTNPNFYERFAQTDDIEFLEDFMPTDEGDRNFIFNDYPRHFELESEAIVKLLPYSGFYPVDRTLDIAALFRTAYSSNAVYAGSSAGTTPAWRSLLRPFFAPGIMYNSIKSGVAVDYPIRRAERNADQYFPLAALHYDTLRGCLSGSLSSATTGAGSIPGNKRRNREDAEWSSAEVNKFFWADRLPFETILDPAAALEEGYEQPTVLSDLNQLLYLDVSGSITPKGLDDTLYKKAVSNFLANVPKFFLSKKENKYGSDGYLAKFVSQFGKPASSEGEVSAPVRTVDVQKDAAYMMEIGLMKTEEFNFYSNPYAYGIPTATGSAAWETLTANQIPKPLSWPRHRGEFAPFTPPHYYGPSLVRITFMPDGGKDSYTLDEIINNDRGEVFVQFLNASSSFYDFTSGSFVDRDGVATSTTGTPDYGWNRAWQNRMDIDASISIGNEFPTDHGGTYKSSDPNKWVIMPKWECPTLDFPDRSGPTDQYAYSSSVNVGMYTSSAQGMWHQYGVMPQTNQGSYLYIKDIPTGESEEYDLVAIGTPDGSTGDVERVYKYVKKVPDFVLEANRTVRSLADLCGFDSEEIIRSGFDMSRAKRLGELAPDNEKSISEAILALPFYIDPKLNEPRLITLQGPADKLGPKVKQFRKQFTKFSLPPALARKLMGMVPKGYPTIPDLINPFGGDDYDSILEGEEMTQTPVVYLMEHKVSLTRQDLSDIWQGVMPELSTKFRQSLSAIDHYMPGDNVEAEPTVFPEVLKEQLALGAERDGHPRYDLLDIAKHPDRLGFFPDIKWLVFKVKERGIPSYTQMVVEEVEGDKAFTYDSIRQSFINEGMDERTASRLLADRDNFSKSIYMLKHHLGDPTYNWPYDYCSVLELGKINTKVGFRPELKSELEEYQEEGRATTRELERAAEEARAGSGVIDSPGVDLRGLTQNRPE
tara:strand:- start:13482 stop:23039 length:9558 start_codon:yes stop_codon:yes gene_type:complete